MGLLVIMGTRSVRTRQIGVRLPSGPLFRASGEMADTMDPKPIAERRAGSSPASRIKLWRRWVMPVTWRGIFDPLLKSRGAVADPFPSWRRAVRTLHAKFGFRREPLMTRFGFREWPFAGYPRMAEWLRLQPSKLVTRVRFSLRGFQLTRAR